MTKITIINELLGKTLDKIIVEKLSDEDIGDQLTFVVKDGDEYLMYHDDMNGCCEVVYLQDIIGSLVDIIGYPLLVAEYVSEEKQSDIECKTTRRGFKKDTIQTVFGWTFYKFATIKGSVTMRWFGEENGCYSTEVSILKLHQE